MLVYVSDHGEEVYDYRDSAGRKAYPENPEMNIKYLNEVPMIIWVSDIWKKRNPQMLEKLKRAGNRPLLTDNVCQLIMGLGGIKANCYHSNRDISSDDYSCNARFINDHSVNYDTLSIAPGKAQQ